MYFFDLDGTLLDSNGIWLDIDIEFLGRRGISPVPEDYTDYVTHHSAPDAARYTRERFSLPETPEEIMEGWMCSPPACLPCAAPPWSTTAFWTALRPSTPPLSWE